MRAPAITAVELHGRLGNQLFQFAMARSVVGPDQPVLVETLFAREDPLISALRSRTFRPLRAGESFRLGRPPSLSGHGRAMIGAGLRLLPGRGYGGLLGCSIYQERFQGRVDPQVFEQDSSVLFKGFFQHEGYFKSETGDLLDSFAEPTKTVRQHQSRWRSSAAGRELVAVVVRAGTDYQRLGWSVPLSWYQAATRSLMQRVERPYFVVFSDISLCAESVALELSAIGPAEPVLWLAPVDQLHLIAEADHVITAATSFGWWGAWLGDAHREFSASRSVIVPDPWCEPGLQTAPQRWHRLATVDVGPPAS